MIAIIDYGAGNTKSVMNAIDRIGVDYLLTDNPNQILSADKVIFPGVGHAAHAMRTISDKNLVEVIKSITKPLLGICIGMQLLYNWSEEGDTHCLGIIDGDIIKFDESNCIVPQMGWSENYLKNNIIFEEMDETSWMYSVHSYRAKVCEYTIATGNYGGEYATAVQKDNFYGVQFHPEKSSKSGQKLIENFIKL